MHQVRQAKERRIGQQLCGRVTISGLALGPGCVEDEICIAYQSLDGCRRDALLRMVGEDDSAFMVGQRDQSDNEPILIRDQVLEL